MCIMSDSLLHVNGQATMNAFQYSYCSAMEREATMNGTANSLRYYDGASSFSALKASVATLNTIYRQ